MKRLLILPVVVALAALAVTSTASAHSGTAYISCSEVLFAYGGFDLGDTAIQETVTIDGSPAVSKTFTLHVSTVSNFEGTDTVPISVPGGTHTVVANATWTGSTPPTGFPMTMIVTCQSPPPPVCTYTKGFYRNHSSVVAGIIGAGTLQVGNAALNASQVQAILNATPGKPGNVTFTSNNLLNLAQQLITAELNVARGSGPSPAAAITAANAAFTTGTAGGGIQLSSSASNIGDLISPLDGFNSGSDCG